MTALSRTIVGRRAPTATRLLAAAGLAAMLGGCYHTQEVAQRDPYPTDYRQRHPITLKEGVRTVEIFVGRNLSGLTPGQRADVLSFAQHWRNEASSGIIIDVPRGGPTNRGAADSMREVNSIFAASGVPRRAIYVRTYRPAPSSLASIKINYSKLTAVAGPCGQWPDDLGTSLEGKDHLNQPYWNLGCATQRNLASMVANPADLVQPRGEAPAYTARRSVAIDKYRKGENPSGTYSPAYDTGKIGSIGK